MDVMTPRQLAEAFWRLMNTNDWRAVGSLLHDDFTLDWPQSGERIRGRSNVAEVNANYPAAGPWTFTIERLVADEREAASDVAVTTPQLTATVISFFEVREGRIWRMREYWPDSFAAASWRAQWVERIE